MQNPDSGPNFGYCVDSFLVERNRQADSLVCLIDMIAKKCNQYGLKGIKIDTINFAQDIEGFGHITVDLISRHFPPDKQEDSYNAEPK